MNASQVAPSTREAVLFAAADCFAQAGFAAARISDIAERAGVGKGTVYEHFQTKEDLLLAACLTLCELRLAKFKAMIAEFFVASAGEQRDPARTLHELIRLLLAQGANDCRVHCRLFVDLWTISKDQPGFLEQVRAGLRPVYAEWERLLGQVVAAGSRSGAFTPAVAPDQLFRLFSALLDGLVWQLTFRPEVELATLASAGADLYLAALGRTPPA